MVCDVALADFFSDDAPVCLIIAAIVLLICSFSWLSWLIRQSGWQNGLRVPVLWRGFDFDLRLKDSRERRTHAGEHDGP